MRIALAWKDKSQGRIIEQLKKLGCMLDWQSLYYTLDSKMGNFVADAFALLFKQGLIYRANRIVSWCPYLQSTLSDLEVENREIDGKTVLQRPQGKQ
jgi:valyl-tRNA synthetase